MVPDVNLKIFNLISLQSFNLHFAKVNIFSFRIIFTNVQYLDVSSMLDSERLQ